MNRLELTCIDFDELFSKYLMNWMSEHEKAFLGKPDELEACMPEVYEQFLQCPAEECGGLSPIQYFAQFDDASELISCLLQYHDMSVPVPDILLERIVELGKPSEQALFSLVSDTRLDEELRIIAVSLLRELDSSLPLELYADALARAEENSGLTEAFADSLLHMGKPAVNLIRRLYREATETGKEAFLDILSANDDDAEVFGLVAERFGRSNKNLGLYASYFTRIGDPKALEILYEAAQRQGLDYLDYIEIVNAIDALGGEMPPEREFSGDPSFEALKHL